MSYRNIRAKVTAEQAYKLNQLTGDATRCKKEESMLRQLRHACIAQTSNYGDCFRFFEDAHRQTKRCQALEDTLNEFESQLSQSSGPQ